MLSGRLGSGRRQNITGQVPFNLMKSETLANDVAQNKNIKPIAGPIGRNHDNTESFPCYSSFPWQ